MWRHYVGIFCNKKKTAGKQPQKYILLNIKLKEFRISQVWRVSLFCYKRNTSNYELWKYVHTHTLSSTHIHWWREQITEECSGQRLIASETDMSMKRTKCCSCTGASSSAAAPLPGWQPHKRADLLQSYPTSTFTSPISPYTIKQRKSACVVNKRAEKKKHRLTGLQRYTRSWKAGEGGN